MSELERFRRHEIEQRHLRLIETVGLFGAWFGFAISVLSIGAWVAG